LADLHDHEARTFLQVIDRCFQALKEISNDPPLCLINGWKHRSQPHLHAHVLPSKEDTRGLLAASEGVEKRKRVDQTALAFMADALRPHFK
jgi:diadenosine tetraphosphate (Ap4A) HIT family hydrolase